MYAELHTIALTTVSAGTCTAYSPHVVTGRVLAIIYTKGDFDAGSTMTVSGETTGQTVWTETAVNASAKRYPRTQVHGADGVGLIYDNVAAKPVSEPIVLVSERIKVLVSSGGDVKTGSIAVIVG